jgi:hypothetical protein
MPKGPVWQLAITEGKTRVFIGTFAGDHPISHFSCFPSL